jgi:acetyl esterase
MPLAPEIEALLRVINTQPQMHQLPIAQLRQTRARIGATGDQAVKSAVDRVIQGPGGPLPLRIYSPDRSGPLALVLFMHGGGFVFGSIDGYYDHVCRVICAQANCRVISVAYRLAPEDKFPAATDDCYAALLWAWTHAAELEIDPSQIFVAGGSAGANLATVTALRARDTGGPALRGQVLLYPITQHHTPPTSSSLACATGYYLTRADVVWFWKQYLRDDADTRNPYALPQQAQSLAGMPPALVISAQYDPLRDEGEQYARRMQDDGVAVTLSRYAGMIHGFLAFPTDKASTALDQCVQWINATAARPA